MYKTEQLIFSNGERYPMLVDEQGIPHFWLTLFVTSQLRTVIKQNTITSYISDIRHFFLWEETQKRNILNEFYNQKLLSDSDIRKIRDHCLLKTESVKKWYETKNVRNVRKLSDKFPSSPRTLARVSGDHAGNRLVRIAEYLDFTGRVLLRNRPNVADINEKITDMKTRLVANKPKGRSSNIQTDPDQKAPPPKVFEQLLKMVQIDSPNNPYKNSTIRPRNALMFNIMDTTGIRSSELLALKVFDIDYHLNLIKIVRRHDDPDDKRPFQPVAKTQERDIPVPPELIKQILDYISDNRAKVNGANKHPFLFVTHQRGLAEGNPLSNSGCRKVLEVAKAINDELFDEVTRHGFRHNFNYRLSKAFDRRNERAKTDKSIKPISEREQNQTRMYLNGWTSEKTAETYNVRYIKEIASKVMLEDMNRQTMMLGGNKKNGE